MSTVLYSPSPGLLSWQAVTYLDVVKSRIQADCHVRPKYAGMVDCFVSSYRQDGLSVFGRGEYQGWWRDCADYIILGFCMISLRAFLVNGATFLGVEYFRKFLRILD